MLETIADEYPEGDVTDDGLFELALFHMSKHDWAGAVAPLEKALGPRAARARLLGRRAGCRTSSARAHLETGAPRRASPSWRA